MKENIGYPYLGRSYIDGRPYVVFFTEPNTGVVVLNNTDSPHIRFGMYGSFDEEKFDILPPELCIRIQN